MRWPSTSAAPSWPRPSSTPTAACSADERIPTPPVWDADELFEVLETCAGGCSRRRAVTDRGHRRRLRRADAVPGRRRQPAEQPPRPWSASFPLRARLPTAFDRPCVVDNDAKALALGERWQGAGRGSNNMLGMVVSTGVGGGIILDGACCTARRQRRPHRPRRSSGRTDPLCGCGARGCVEGGGLGSGWPVARRRPGRGVHDQPGARRDRRRHRGCRAPGRRSGRRAVSHRRRRASGAASPRRPRCWTWSWSSSAAASPCTPGTCSVRRSRPTLQRQRPPRLHPRPAGRPRRSWATTRALLGAARARVSTLRRRRLSAATTSIRRR